MLHRINRAYFEVYRDCLELLVIDGDKAARTKILTSSTDFWRLLKDILEELQKDACSTSIAENFERMVEEVEKILEGR